MLLLLLGLVVGFALGVLCMGRLSSARQQADLHHRLWTTLHLHGRTGRPVYLSEDAADYIPLQTFTRN